MCTTCTHTRESGSTCKSPAIRGTSLCFQHTPHEPIKRRLPDEYQPFELPNVQSKNGLILGISMVLDQLAKRHIKRSEADTFLRGFNLLTRLMTDLDKLAAQDLMEMQQAQAAAQPESEVTSESIQKTLDEIAEGLGVEMPTLEEMRKLQASMPHGTPEQALEHWISSGRIRPRQPQNDPRPHLKIKERPSRPDCPHLERLIASRRRPSMQQTKDEHSSNGEQIQIAAHAPAGSNQPIPS